MEIPEVIKQLKDLPGFTNVEVNERGGVSVSYGDQRWNFRPEGFASMKTLDSFLDFMEVKTFGKLLEHPRG